MNKTFLNYPIIEVPIEQVEYNDDYLIISDGGIREDEPGWYAPDGHKSKKYLHQTGQILRNVSGYEFTREDYFRSRLLYKNLHHSITTFGLQSPLVVIRWINPDDIEWTIPYNWGIWREFWESKPDGEYYRVVQGNNRLMVLRDLDYDMVPVIDITDESLELHRQGICPAKTWVNSEKRKIMENSAENVGFHWARAHNHLLYS